ncbi:MAG: cysteine-rich CWC family protein [Phycisphaerae bacterium]|nr:cysteine-rich CWC family protein [Gemmatimonadaceae bacterium]
MNADMMDPSLCPLCAKTNRCAMVDGGKSCWCMTASIPREAVERLPAAQQGVACLCEACCTLLPALPVHAVPRDK